LAVVPELPDVAGGVVAVLPVSISRWAVALLEFASAWLALKDKMYSRVVEGFISLVKCRARGRSR